MGHRLLHERGGDAQRLLAIAAGDADQARVVMEGVERLLEGSQLLEQRAEVVGDEELMSQPLQRRALLRPPLGAARRHHHELIPLLQPCGAADVLDLAEPRPQIVDGAHPSPSSRASREASRCGQRHP